MRGVMYFVAQVRMSADEQGETVLAVDVGNTFTRLVSFSGSVIGRRMSFHSRDLELEELTRAFRSLAKEGEKVWVSSVAPPVNSLIDSAAERAGLLRHFIRPDVDFILPHSLSTPWSTGVDRLLSAYAAGALHFPRAGDEKGYVVVQCGSAATVDLVDGDGVFRGGYILPGPTFWLLGLSVGVQLPNLASEIPDWRGIEAGDNTHDAMLHGMQLALPVAVASAAMLITAKEGRYGEKLPVAITGGWGEAAVPYLRSRHVFDSDLLLHGIRLFAERNAF